MERIDDLMVNGLRLIQDDELFCFGTDSVEIGNFVTAQKGEKALDLGAGNGIITILLAGKKGIFTSAVEIDPRQYQLILKNIELNGLQNMANAINLPIQQLKNVIKPGEYQIIVSNPPYFRVDSGFDCKQNKINARKETSLTQLELLQASSYLLNDKGKFFVVYPVDRLAEMLSNCRQQRLEPKEMVLLHSPNKPPHLFMLKCVKNGKIGLKINVRPIKNQGIDWF